MAPLPINVSLLLQPTRPAGMLALALPPRDALYALAPLLLHCCRKVTPDRREQVVL